MIYEIFLAPRAKKQYEAFDRHIRDEIRPQLLALEDDRLIIEIVKVRPRGDIYKR